MYSMKYLVVLCITWGSMVLAALSEINLDESTDKIPVEIIRSIEKCSTDGGLTGVVNCAAMRSLKHINNVIERPVIELLPGVALISDPSKPRTITDQTPEENLPKEPEARAAKLTDLLIERTMQLFAGRTLKVKLPENDLSKISRSLEEGRAKMKKMMGPFLLGLGSKLIAIVPILIGGLAIFTTKALIVAKLALIVSGILFAQNYLGGHNSLPFPGGNGMGTNYGAPSYGAPVYGAPAYSGTNQVAWNGYNRRSIGNFANSDAYATED